MFIAYRITIEVNPNIIEYFNILDNIHRIFLIHIKFINNNDNNVEYLSSQK
jgi:hypothetical protein